MYSQRSPIQIYWHKNKANFVRYKDDHEQECLSVAHKNNLKEIIIIINKNNNNYSIELYFIS